MQVWTNGQELCQKLRHSHAYASKAGQYHIQMWLSTGLGSYPLDRICVSDLVILIGKSHLACVLQVNAPQAPEQPVKQPPAQQASMTREERNHLVLSLLESLTLLIRKHATAYGLDFDDMYQEASIAIIRRLDDGIDGINNLTGFMGMVVKRELIDKLRHSKRLCRQCASLDAPISQDDDSFSLADLLPSSYAYGVEPLAILLAQESIQELSPQLVQPNPSRRRAIRDRYDTALALCEVAL